jgi:hypothetical protein
MTDWHPPNLIRHHSIHPSIRPSSIDPIRDRAPDAGPRSRGVACVVWNVVKRLIVRNPASCAGRLISATISDGAFQAGKGLRRLTLHSPCGTGRKPHCKKGRVRCPLSQALAFSIVQLSQSRRSRRPRLLFSCLSRTFCRVVGISVAHFLLTLILAPKFNICV